LIETWLNPNGPDATPPSSIVRVFDELCSPRGPFWLDEGERDGFASSTSVSRRTQLEGERRNLIDSIPTNIPQAVVVLEGGPASTKHEGFNDAPVYLRGNPATPGKIIARGLPQFLAGENQPAITHGSGRLRLADWIASPNNPLTARVAMNRIWQHHFGQGIVRTSTNFGRRGEPPTHAGLLDYLAVRFTESGGSLKAMHRLIMLSAVYQQQSVVPPDTAAADPENLWLGRMNRKSLDAEELRDSLLMVAGGLDRHAGGPGFQDITLKRRSLYLMSVRTGAKSSFASVFDGPDCTAVVEKRTVSTVAPQALFLLNDPFTHEQARRLARRIEQSSGKRDPETNLRAAYRWVLSRAPTNQELAIGGELLRATDPQDSLERFCQLLLCTNEFFYLD